MKLQMHAYLDGKYKLEKPVSFTLKDYIVVLNNNKFDEENVVGLSVTRDIEFEELNIGGPRSEKVIRNKIAYFENEFREVSTLVEAYLMITFNHVIGRFNLDEITINIISANKEEKDELWKEIYFQGGGGIHVINKPGLLFPELKEKDIHKILKLSKNIPVLALFSEGRRQHYAKNNEIAFGLFFKVIEGVFLENTKNREKQFIQKKLEIEKFLPFYQSLYDALIKLLTVNLKLKITHRKDSYEDMLVLLVRLRDQLAHFNQDRSQHYFDFSMGSDLNIVNSFMINAILRIIYDKFM